MGKVVAVIGASSDRRKFGNRAVRAFARQGYTVVPINPHETQVEGLKAYAVDRFNQKWASIVGRNHDTDGWGRHFHDQFPVPRMRIILGPILSASTEKPSLDE